MDTNYTIVSWQVPKKLLILVFLVSLFMVALLTPTVHAEYPESREGEHYAGVWVAFDEEGVAEAEAKLEDIKTALDYYKNDYGINYAICYYATWDSNDLSHQPEDLLYQAMIQTEWFVTMNETTTCPPRLKFGNWTHADGSTHLEQENWVNILLAVTGQDLTGSQGAAHWWMNACIVDIPTPWPHIFWKTIVHELGHVYGLDECSHISPVCYMNPDWYYLAGGFRSYCFDDMVSEHRHKFTWMAPPWDINEDGIIDVFDLAILGHAYGAFFGDPRYNPDADINQDGVVDGRDMAFLTWHWGEEYLADL